MGSFNVGCGISGVSIRHGDRTGFVVLDNARDYPQIRQYLPNPGRSMHIYPTDLYLPVLPPVYGIYNDYGALENIEPSITTHLLESEFHRPVETVLACIAGRDDIYHARGEIAENYLLPGHRLREYRLQPEEYLLSIGFTEIAEDDYEFDGAHLQLVDDRWQITRGQQVLAENLHWDVEQVLGLFAHHTRSLPGFARADWDAIERLNAYSGMFFLGEVFEQLGPVLLADNVVTQMRFDTFEQHWVEFVAKFSEQPSAANRYAGQFASSWFTKMNDYLRDNTGLRPQDYDLLRVYGTDMAFRDLITLFETLSSMNRMYMPSLYGAQWDTGFEKMREISAAILRRRELIAEGWLDPSTVSDEYHTEYGQDDSHPA